MVDVCPTSCEEGDAVGLNKKKKAAGIDQSITKSGQQLAPRPDQNISQKRGLQRADSEQDKLL